MERRRMESAMSCARILQVDQDREPSHPGVARICRLGFWTDQGFNAYFVTGTQNWTCSNRLELG